MEAERTIPPETEVQLYFSLPETPKEFEPTARVVWCRSRSQESTPSGMGLRFLGMDRTSAQRLEAYVYERAPVVSSVAS